MRNISQVFTYLFCKPQTFKLDRSMAFTMARATVKTGFIKKVPSCIEEIPFYSKSRSQMFQREIFLSNIGSHGNVDTGIYYTRDWRYQIINCHRCIKVLFYFAKVGKAPTFRRSCQSFACTFRRLECYCQQRCRQQKYISTCWHGG
jgi:hypothetical protein